MLNQGHLIEYLEGGRFLCAFVLEAQGKRLRLLNQNSREVSLPAARVVTASQRPCAPSGGREAMLQALAEAARRRARLAEDMDLEAIWEMVKDEEDSIYKPDFLAELVCEGDLDDDFLAAFVRAVLEDRTFFRYKNERITVHSAEEVERLREQAERERRQREFIAQGAQAMKEIMAGREASDADWPGRERCLAAVEDYYLRGGEAQEADLARHLLKAAGLARPHDPYYLLIRAGRWRPHENIPLLRSDLPREFGAGAMAVVEEARERYPDILAEPHRRDLRDLEVFTIDGESTRDFDDALHLRELDGGLVEIGVHISDTAACVPVDSPLFQEARDRATSLYFPEGVLPMLPKELSQDLCSLVQGQDRPAQSFIMQVDPRGQVVSREIRASVIRVARRLTYTEADRLLEEGDPLFVRLEELRLALRNRRLDAGALMLPFPDVNIDLAADGEVRVSLSPVDTPARSMVSECMILANTVAARHIGDQGAPGLFRSQGPPRQRIVEGLEHDLHRLIQQRKQLSRGDITTSARPHSGLGVDCYTTITSPIRRFLDLVMQHQLAALLRGEAPPLDEEACRDCIGALQQNLGRANNVRQQRHRYWLLRHYEMRVGSRVEALVVSRGPQRTGLLLLDTLVEVDLPSNAGARVSAGDRVRVRIARASALDNVLRVEW